MYDSGFHLNLHRSHPPPQKEAFRQLSILQVLWRSDLLISEPELKFDLIMSLRYFLIKMETRKVLCVDTSESWNSSRGPLSQQFAPNLKSQNAWYLPWTWSCTWRRQSRFSHASSRSKFANWLARAPLQLWPYFRPSWPLLKLWIEVQCLGSQKRQLRKFLALLQTRRRS